MLQSPQSGSPPPADRPLSDRIREAVQQQVEAAREQAQAAAQARTDREIDARIDPQIDIAVDRPELTPTVVVRRDMIDEIPPQAVDITLMFFLTVFAIIVGFPIARAIARWIDRRGQQPRLPVDISTQLNQISQSVDAMAIEIERISEGQRFTTKLLAEQSRHAGLASGGELPPS